MGAPSLLYSPPAIILDLLADGEWHEVEEIRPTTVGLRLQFDGKSPDSPTPHEQWWLDTLGPSLENETPAHAL